MGPRKTEDGNWLPHTLLGDVEDYEEMERELGHAKSPQNQEISEDGLNGVMMLK